MAMPAHGLKTNIKTPDNTYKVETTANAKNGVSSAVVVSARHRIRGPKAPTISLGAQQARSDVILAVVQSLSH
jgi:hypothetical protein